MIYAFLSFPPFVLHTSSVLEYGGPFGLIKDKDKIKEFTNVNTEACSLLEGSVRCHIFSMLISLH